MSQLKCARCGNTGDQLPYRPFQNEIGLKVFEQICADCWAEWGTAQKQIINHYGLDVRDPKAKATLYAQMEEFLFAGSGGRAGEREGGDVEKS
jgi:Fe-S cluster biosynthesis and repair protein YggX